MPPKPIFSPSSLQHCPLPPGPSSLWHRVLSLSRHHPLPPISSPFPSTLPSFLGTCSLSMPSSSPAPALFGPQHPPSFRYRSTKQDRTEDLGSILFDRTKGLRSAMAEQMPSVQLTGSNRGSPFGSVWSNDTKKNGALRAGEGRCQKAEERCRERVDAGEWREGSGKEKETKGREPMPKSRGGALE